MKLPLRVVAPVLISIATVLASATAGVARPAHHHHHHHHSRSAQLFAPPPSFDQASSFAVPSGYVSAGRASRVSRRQARRLARHAAYQAAAAGAISNSPAAATSGAAFSGIGGSDLVSEARRYIGGNPTGKSSLWCGNFMNLVLERTGHGRSNSNQARSFASYGQRISSPQVGAIAVMSRRGGGHVGVVSGVDARGNVIVVSGNHNRRVAESVYPRSRIFAYVMPK